MVLAYEIWTLEIWSTQGLGDEKIVKGMPSINHPNQLCEACLLGKNARSFPKEANSRAKEPLKLVHADVCGSINLSSFGKNKYFLLKLLHMQFTYPTSL